ncbi:sugar ABC transporter substrate-binding protein [Halalkalicoccus tibetensis]|uniref:ABC transporter substrate-binding protein n=1 Tax=Halalkalicoccus tibetensis TaxID=175632 RepID=A0ABD5VBX4_9EURY
MINDQNKMYRRSVLGALGAASLAGCIGGGGGNSGNTVEVTHWEEDAEAQHRYDQMETWSSSHEDWEAELRLVPGDPAEEYHESMQTEIAGGEGPDILYLQYEASYPSFSSENALQNLDSLIEEGEINLDDYYERSIDMYTWTDGSMYALPAQVTPASGFWYNTELFEEVGIESIPDNWTWEDFRGILEDLKEGGVDNPYIIPFNQSITDLFYPFIWQNGAEFVNEDYTESRINSSEAVEALEFIVGLIEDDLAVADVDIGDRYSVAFGEELGAATLGGPWILDHAMNEGIADKIGCTTPPIPEGGEQASVLNSHGVGMNANMESEAQLELFKFLTSEDGVEYHLEALSGLSPMETHSDHPIFEEEPRLQPIQELIPHSNPMIFGEHTNQIVAEALLPPRQGAYTGDLTPREAIESMHNSIESILS